MKTVKYIADEIGVSKQAINKRLSRLPTTIVATIVTTNEKGVRLINSDGEAILKAAMKVKLPPTEPEVADNQPTTETKVADNQNEYYVILKNEIDAKNKQISEIQQIVVKQQDTIKNLTETIAVAHQTLQAEQLLHAGTKKMLMLSDGQKREKWWLFWKRSDRRENI